jgi:hypothetical protein
MPLDDGDTVESWFVPCFCEALLGGRASHNVLLE